MMAPNTRGEKLVLPATHPLFYLDFIDFCLYFKIAFPQAAPWQLNLNLFGKEGRVVRKLLARIKQANWRLVIANTAALVIYSAWTGTISITIEMLYSGSTFRQWAGTRLIYVVLKFALADIYCANLTNFLRKKFGGNSRHLFKEGVADALSISFYQQSIYIPSALLAGANITKTLFAAKFYFIESLLLGWVYGLLLNWCRKKIAGIVNDNGNGTNNK
jgi:hypothetical protein